MRKYLLDRSRFNVELPNGQKLAIRSTNLKGKVITTNKPVDVTTRMGHLSQASDESIDIITELGNDHSGSESEVEVHSDIDAESTGFNEAQVAGRLRMAREVRSV